MKLKQCMWANVEDELSSLASSGKKLMITYPLCTLGAAFFLKDIIEIT